MRISITYIIGHYSPLARIIDLVSHTTYVMCVNFIHECRDLQLNDDSERTIFFFEKLFIAILITLRIFASNLLIACCRRTKKSKKKAGEEILFVFCFYV